MRLILLGPPGIGKGTQARILSKKFSLLHLSTGDMLRDEIFRETELGILARSYIDDGNLVPDKEMLDMMTHRLKQEDAESGYILDGFPRTIPQAEGLEKILDLIHQKLDVVISLEGSDDVLIERLSNRRTCPDCGRITNLIFTPPAVAGKCDSCGGKLYQRNDDRPEVIRERLKVYEDLTSPLLKYYSSRGLLKTVSGVATVKEIRDNILSELQHQPMEE